MNYADYQYYVDEFRGSLNNDLFSFYIIRANKEINKNINTVLTNEKIEELTEQEQDNIKYVACSLVDYLNTNKQTTYSSLSIDGVSKTVKNNDILKKEKAEILNNLPKRLTRYL